MSKNPHRFYAGRSRAASHNRGIVKEKIDCSKIQNFGSIFVLLFQDHEFPLFHELNGFLEFLVRHPILFPDLAQTSRILNVMHALQFF